MIKGIVSDLDGTITDSINALASAWHMALVQTGAKVNYLEVMDTLKGINGLSLRELSEKHIVNMDEDAYINILELRKDFAKKRLSKKLIFPDAEKVLAELRSRKIKIGIATSLSKDLLESVKEVNQLDRFADVILSADEVMKNKPEPDVFMECFKRLGVEPKEGIIIGDTANDIIPANAIGSFSVLISRDGEKTANCKPDFVVHDFGPLPGIVDKLNKKA